MGLFTKRRFTRTSDGSYTVRLRDDERALLAALPDQLEALVIAEPSAATTRLFPPAYADDAEGEAEYRRLMGDELIKHRLDAVATLRDTVDRTRLTGEELSAWVGVLNDVRLVLGTVLDVTEDRDVLDVDPHAEDAAQRVIYVVLSSIVEEGVLALSSGLPPPSRD